MTRDTKIESSQSATVLSPEDLVDLEKPSYVRLSPGAKRVVYQVQPIGRKGKKTKSALWAASVGVEGSASQVTSGEYNDINPVWDATQDVIYFLSDRPDHEETSVLYSLRYPHGQARPLTLVSNKKSISTFVTSPDGKWIAYCSPDEDSQDRIDKKDKGDDAEVYGEYWEMNRVRLLDLSTEEITTVFEKDVHAQIVAFSADSRKIAITTTATTTIDTGIYQGTDIWLYDLQTKLLLQITMVPNEIGSLAFGEGSTLYFTAGWSPHRMQTAQVVWRLDLTTKNYKRHAFGNVETVERLRGSAKNVTTLVQRGLMDEVYSVNTRTNLIHEQGEAIADFDFVARILVTVSSSVARPHEVYSFINGERCQLSTHGKAISNLNLAHAEQFSCENSDGLKLEGIFAKPTSAPEGPLPTAFFVHGGPYSRTTLQYDLTINNTTPFLLSNGYAVLLPNYRGSSGRGELFATQAQGTMGTVDYEDIICVLKAAISEGLVDPERVVIGGWSQGGFLSYFSTISTGFQFKGAICGAGVTDWDTLSMTSDGIYAECELAGGAPWRSSASSLKSRAGSAIWHLDNLKTPMLLLHGEKDERVPVSQAKSWYEGCRQRDIPCELVVYPREPHGPQERSHIIDIIKRVKLFCDTHLASK